jgi:hypothetical protein
MNFFNKISKVLLLLIISTICFNFNIESNAESVTVNKKLIIFFKAVEAKASKDQREFLSHNKFAVNGLTTFCKTSSPRYNIEICVAIKDILEKGPQIIKAKRIISNYFTTQLQKGTPASKQLRTAIDLKPIRSSIDYIMLNGLVGTKEKDIKGLFFENTIKTFDLYLNNSKFISIDYLFSKYLIYGSQRNSY